MRETPSLNQRAIAYGNKKGQERWTVKREWTRTHLKKWGFSFRRGTTVARKLPANVGELHQLFVQRLAFLAHHNLPADVTMLNSEGERVPVTCIPPELIVNFDQTALPFICFRNTTWAEKGCKDVPLGGMDDKRTMTAVVGSNAAGEGAPLQIILGGRTNGCVQIRKMIVC